MVDGHAADEIYLLDTHVWIWAFQADHEHLSPGALARLDRAAHERRTRVSAISVWEVGRLLGRERITVDISVDDWIAGATAAFAFGGGVIAVDSRIALESTRLPSLAHKDPADRFLIATARATGARLVTVDRVLLAYGRTGHVRVLDPHG